MSSDKNYHELLQGQQSIVSALRDEIMVKQKSQRCDNRPVYMRMSPDKTVPPVARIDMNGLDSEPLVYQGLRKALMKNEELYARYAMGDFVGIKI